MAEELVFWIVLPMLTPIGFLLIDDIINWIDEHT